MTPCVIDFIIDNNTTRIGSWNSGYPQGAPEYIIQKFLKSLLINGWQYNQALTKVLEKDDNDSVPSLTNGFCDYHYIIKCNSNELSMGGISITMKVYNGVLKEYVITYDGSLKDF